MLSIDAAYCKAIKYDMAHQTDFTPEQSVKSASFWPASNSPDLTVIVPPWHAPEWYLRRQSHIQNKLGRSALYFELNDNILSADAQKTLDSFTFVADAYESKLKALGLSPTRWLAGSLGGSLLMHILGTKHLPHPNIKLLAPGADLARCLWSSLRTQQLRHQFEAAGIDEEQLVELWRPLSPIFQAEHINDSTVEMRISLADKIIRPNSAFELAEALEVTNRVSVITNRYLGHYGTLLADLLISPK